jgi:hypothetical protein
MASFGSPGPATEFDLDESLGGGADEAGGLLGLCREGKHRAPGERERAVRPLDLDTEEGLAAAELESSELQARMAQARMAQRRAPLLAAAPAAPDLARQDREARQELSALTVGARDQQGQLQIVRDAVHLEASNAVKLQRGGLPHGFPEPAGAGEAELERLRASLGVLGARLAAACQVLDAEVARAQDFARRLALTRRLYESVAGARVPPETI